MLFDPSLRHEWSILCCVNADLWGEADSSKYTAGIIVYALGTIVVWKTKNWSIVAHSTMQAEIISTLYGQVQMDWL
jgi:hypothetical protein